MPGATDERRRYVRYPLLLRVEPEESDAHAAEWTENLSTGGMLIQSQRQRTEVRLSFPGLLDPVGIVGRIAWQRPASAWEPAAFGLDALEGVEHLERIAGAWRDKAPDPANPDVRLLAVRTEIPPMAASGRVALSYAEGPDEALDLAAQHPFDLIVTELFAPIADCLRMIKDLQQVKVPILGLHTREADDGARALGAGASGVLPDGLRPLHLCQTLVSLHSLRG